MNQKKYISDIVKQLKCSKAKREDIRKQLTADVEDALSGGDALEEIIKRMGKPQTVAAEFNENFPEEEKKAAKKQKLIKDFSIAGIVLIGIFIFLYWWAPKTGEITNSSIFDEETVRKQAEFVVQLLDKEDYDGLREIAGASMQTSLAEENLGQWQTAKSDLNAEWGAFVSFGKAYMAEVKQLGKQYAIVQMNASYENVSVTYTITFDTDMKLAGLYMK